MKAQRFSEAGFSLPEIMISLAVFCVLAAFALSTLSKQKIQFQRQDVARQLKIFLDRARFDSIKRDASTADEMAGVTFDSPYSYSLTSDLNQNGILESNEIRQVSLPQNGNVKVIGNATVFPISIKFNFRGQVTAIDGVNSSIAPVFVVCDSGCTLANANPDNSNTVAVSPSGTVSLLDGGKSVANTSQPMVSTVGVNEKIKGQEY